MIAAVLGPRARSEVDALIRRISGDEAGHFLNFEGGALFADRRVPAGFLDEARSIAWSGTIRNREALESSPASSLKGDYAAIARGGSLDLTLVRGRFGGRPLFYSWIPSGQARALLVSSRLESLVAALPTPPPLDVEKLAGTLLGGVPAEHDRTNYVGVYRVPSATILRIDEHRVTSCRGIPFPRVSTNPHDPDLVASELRDRILASVSRAIEGASRVGVFVGGGVDSSALLAAAMQVTRGTRVRIEPLNIEFAAEGDDRGHFDVLCRELGVSPIRVAPEEGGAHWRRSLVIDRAPYPYGSQIGCMIRLVERAREQGSIDLVLTGDGGDALFDGDLRVFAEKARRGDVLDAVRAAWELEALGRSTARLRVEHLVVRPWVRHLLPALLREAWRARQRRPPGWAGPALLRFVRDGADAFEIEPEDEAASGEVRMGRLSRAGLMLELRDMRAQLEIAMGCDCADPFFDDDLAEFVASVSPDLLFHGGRKRGLFRHALRGLVPDSVRLRPDKSFFEPALTRQILATGGFESLRPLARVEKLADLRLVEPRGFLRDFDELARAPENGRLWAVLWPVLCAEAFVSRYPRGEPS